MAPVPTDGENIEKFVKRCIPYLIHEGKHPNTPKGRKAAAGECYGIYRSKHKSEDEVAKCIKCGLKDATGHFCRYDKHGEKFYYDINDADSKQLAKTKAEEFGVNLKSKELLDIIDKQEEPGGDGRDAPVDGDPTNRPSDDGDKREEFIKECIAKKVGNGESESTAREQCIQAWDSNHKSYIVPKSKDDITHGTIVSYKGKIGKVVKVINT
jgi:hypothetical protein